MELIIGGLIAFINMIIMFEIKRLSDSVVKLTENTAEALIEISIVKTKIHACPSCREATGA